MRTTMYADSVRRRPKKAVNQPENGRWGGRRFSSVEGGREAVVRARETLRPPAQTHRGSLPRATPRPLPWWWVAAAWRGPQSSRTGGVAAGAQAPRRPGEQAGRQAGSGDGCHASILVAPQGEGCRAQQQPLSQSRTNQPQPPPPPLRPHLGERPVQQRVDTPDSAVAVEDERHGRLRREAQVRPHGLDECPSHE